MGESPTSAIRSHLVECPACRAPNPTNATICWHCERPTATPGDPEPRVDAAEAWISGLGIRVEPHSAEADPRQASRSIGIRGLTVLAVTAVGGIVAAAFLLRDVPPLVRSPEPERSSATSVRLDATTRMAPPSGSTVEPRPAPATAPASAPPRKALEPRPPVNAGDAEAAFGMSRRDPADEPASSPPATTPAGCAPAIATLGLCPPADSPKEKPP